LTQHGERGRRKPGETYEQFRIRSKMLTPTEKQALRMILRNQERLMKFLNMAIGNNVTDRMMDKMSDQIVGTSRMIHALDKENE
jgi:hypothetical protein